MPSFIEAVSKQHLWRWLETERGCTIHAEAKMPNGRVDLAGVTSDGKYIAVELKSNVPEYPTDYYDQLSRYLTSGYFDKVYFASHDATAFQTRLSSMDVSYPSLRTAARHLNGGIDADLYSKSDIVETMNSEFSSDFLHNEEASLPGFEENCPQEYISCRLGASTSYEPVDLERGMQMIQNARAPQDIGIIKVPIGGVSISDTTYRQESLKSSKIKHPRSTLGLDSPEPPSILKPATPVSRSNALIGPTQDREPFVRQQIWLEFTGLPEASIPNITNSDQGHRPIDVLSFRGGIDPVKICEREDGEIIGIEAKGVTPYEDFSNELIVDQLKDYATSGGLSRLFLAVPKKLRPKARTLLQQESMNDLVGLITVSTDGTTEIVTSAPQLNLRYDSYVHKGQTFRIGYDELTLPNDASPNSAYIHDKEHNRLRARRRRAKENKVHDIQTTAERLISNKSGQSASEGWLMYDDRLPNRECVSNGVHADDKIRSYLVCTGFSNDSVTTTRMTLFSTDCEHVTDNLVLSFYNKKLWMVGRQIEFFTDALSSISNITGAKMETINSDSDLVNIQLTSTSDLDHGKCKLHVDVPGQQSLSFILTGSQWKDLVASAVIIREHSGLSMPEASGIGTPRIGPNGNSTWSLGRNVEGRAGRDAFPNDMDWPKR